MFRLGKWVFRKVSQSLSTDQDALREEIQRLQQSLLQQQSLAAQEKLENDMLTKQRKKEENKETDCFKKTGTVTSVHPQNFIVDGIYYVPKQLLKQVPSGVHVEENTRLDLLVYQKLDPTTNECSTKVVKILAVHEGDWVVDEMTEETSIIKSEASVAHEDGGPVYYDRTERHEPGKVISQDRNTITVETNTDDAIIVERDKTHITFVPEIGDYVILSCDVQVDRRYIDLKGEVLDVKALRPSRMMSGTGNVVVANGKAGEVRSKDEYFFYNNASLVANYTPKVGDTVQYQAVENQSVARRCISVKLVGVSLQRQNDARAGDQKKVTPLPQPKRPTSDLYEDKHGLRLIGEFEVEFKDIDEMIVRTVTIRNESDKKHKIEKLMLPLNTSQLRLVEPYTHSLIWLFPGETAEYRFEITGNHYGRSQEKCVWCFGGGFRIGRSFLIRVSDEDMIPSEIPNVPRTDSFFKRKLAAFNSSQRKATQIIPGRKITKTPNFVARQIPHFEVPFELFELVAGTEQDSEIRDSLNEPPYNMKDALGPANYRRQFHTFLYLEEIHQRIEFRKYDQEKATFARHEQFLTLSVPGVHESRHSLIVGNVAYAKAPEGRISSDQSVFQGVIHKVSRDKVYLLFNTAFHQNYNGESYQVHFDFGRGVFRKQHHALEEITKVMGSDYLFPQRIQFNEPKLDVHLNEREELVLMDGDDEGILRWYNDNLNVYQKAAIVNVLRSEARPFPYIIFGPPGTGKTLTTVELICQLVANMKDCRIIVTTPSNSAAYLITQRLAQTGLLEPGEFVRLVSNTQVEREQIPPDLAGYCATVSISDEKNAVGEDIITTASGLRMKLQAKHIGCNRVTISTCNCIGTLLNLRFPPNHFTHIIVDEAGQCLEPESLIPICLSSRTGTVVLVGDPQQLGAVTMNRYAKDHFGTSLVERLLQSTPMYAVDKLRFPEADGYDPRLVSKLRINYRSIPSVLSVYNDLFYGGKLIPFHSENTASDTKLLGILHRLLEVKRETPDCGVFFHGVDGLNLQSSDSPSWFNPSEAKTVFRMVVNLFRKGYGHQDIGIITPYTMQITSILHIFSAAQFNETPKVGTVEEFQGQERNIIIVSTVRSSSIYMERDKRAALGFVANEKRINVAISRAKVALIVVGNPKLLCLDPIWKQILDRAINNGTYVGIACKETTKWKDKVLTTDDL
ncbi:probable RNA helicase armi [Anopheles bellator]|uniref:probable RNA helicase armi n=1 Tax=Anopheles bellator TaxID=139047 RepID=UPI002648B8BB|nr:probable RNA helicase armi [Anopheles bellator]